MIDLVQKTKAAPFLVRLCFVRWQQPEKRHLIRVNLKNIWTRIKADKRRITADFFFNKGFPNK